MPDSITIDTITPTDVDASGGMLLRILGDFVGQVGAEYAIHVGATGTTADPKCHSGLAGQSTRLVPLSAGELRGYLPSLTPGATLSVLVRRADGTREQLEASVLTVTPRGYYGSVFDLRTVLPTYYFVGPRNLENLGAL
jgi:hypothetical protein